MKLTKEHFPLSAEWKIEQILKNQEIVSRVKRWHPNDEAEAQDKKMILGE